MGPQILVDDKGVGGGKDSESDEDYRARILAHLRQGVRYGKSGDWAAWALDSSPEVNMAWEFPNYDSSGFLLIQVLGSSHTVKVVPVHGIEAVNAHLRSVTPPLPWLVRTPSLVPLNPHISYQGRQNNQPNQKAAEAALKAWLQDTARPGMRIYRLPDSLLQAAQVDGENHLQGFYHVLLPLLAPGLVTTGLLTFINSWNEYLFALTFTLMNQAAQTVTVAIAFFQGRFAYALPYGEIMAATIVISIPLILVVILFQSKIVDGLTAGALKG